MFEPIKVWCARHDYMGNDDCKQCTDMVCEQCQQRPSTANWAGTHDALSIARNSRLVQRWCERCVVEAQIAYMTPMVDKLAVLKARLEELKRS